MAQQEFSVDVKALQCAAIEAGIGTSIISMAKATGLDRNTIANIYSKKSRPGSDAMYRIAKACKLQPEQCGKIFFAKELSQHERF